MAKLVLDDVLDAWEADRPPAGFAERVIALAAERAHGLPHAQAPSACLRAESCLDAWEAEPPPAGFTRRVILRAAERQARERRRKVLWAAAVTVLAMAAGVAGLLLNRLPMPWDHAETLSSISTRIPAAPSIPREPALHLVEQAAERTSPAPLPTTPKAPLRAQRAPQWREKPNRNLQVENRLPTPKVPSPDEPANFAPEDRKQARFDLAAYKRARASALLREKRFNKTEGSGKTEIGSLILGTSYRLARVGQ